MKAVPVWVQVYLSGSRWGVMCGILFGWLCAGAMGIGIDGAPSVVGTLVGFLFLGVLYGTIPGAIFGLLVGTVVGVASGLVLQVALRLTDPFRATVATFALVIGIPTAGIAVTAIWEPWALTYLAIPAIASAPLLRTLHRVANEWASPEIHQHRRDTFAA